MRQRFAGLVQAHRHPVRRVARGDVEQDRVAGRRDAGRERIGREHRRYRTERCDAVRRRIDAVDERDETPLRGALRVRGEARDVVRAADHDRSRTLRRRHRLRGVDCTQREPRARQPLPVPGLRGLRCVDRDRLAGLAHPIVCDLVEVAGQQREAVRRVAHQVAVEQDRGGIARDVAAHTRGEQQRIGVRAKRFGGVTHIGSRGLDGHAFGRCSGAGGHRTNLRGEK